MSVGQLEPGSVAVDPNEGEESCNRFFCKTCLDFRSKGKNTFFRRRWSEWKKRGMKTQNAEIVFMCFILRPSVDDTAPFRTRVVEAISEMGGEFFFCAVCEKRQPVSFFVQFAGNGSQ